MNWPDDFCTSLSSSSFEGQEDGKCAQDGCRSLISWNLDCKKIRMSTSGRYLSSRTNRVVNDLKGFTWNASRMCCSGRLASMKENGMDCLLIEFVNTLRIYRCDSGSPLGNGRGLQTRAGHGYGWSRSRVRVGELKPQENPHPQQGFDGFSGVSDR